MSDEFDVHAQEIVERWHKAGGLEEQHSWGWGVSLSSAISDALRSAVKAERDQCAGIAAKDAQDSIALRDEANRRGNRLDARIYDYSASTAEAIATAIRARGESNG